MAFPDGLTLITVSGHFDVAAEGDAYGQIEFYGRYPLVGPDDDSILAPFAIAVALVAGDFEVQLPATNDPAWTPQDWAYAVRATAGGSSIRGTLQLDYQTATVDLDDLIQIDGTAEPGHTYLALSQRSIAGGVAGLDADGDVIDAGGNKVTGGGGGGGDVTLSNTVTSAVAYGTSAAAGAATSVSRGDHTHGSHAAPASSDISDATTTGKAVLTATDQATARTAIGAETSGAAADAQSAAESYADGIVAALDSTVAAALGDKVDDSGGTGFSMANGAVVSQQSSTRIDIGFANAATGAGFEVYRASDAGKPGQMVLLFGGFDGGQLTFMHYDDESNYVAVAVLDVDGLTITGDLSVSGTVTGIGTDDVSGLATALDGKADTDDSRLSDARTPTTHASTHADGGSDEVALDGSQVTAGTVAVGRLPTGTSGTTVALGNHNHSGVYQPVDSDLTTIAGLTATTNNFMVAASSAWASRTPSQAKTALSLVKGDVGLGNVDNTADTAKPISTATQTALDDKVETADYPGLIVLGPTDDVPDGTAAGTVIVRTAT